MHGSRLRGLAIALLAIHLVLGYSHNFSVGADDDRLWLYMTGAELSRPALAAELNGRLEAAGADGTINEKQAARFGLRTGYHRNYLAASGVYAGVAAATRRLIPGWQRDYPAYLARALFAGFVTLYGVASLALIAIVVLASDQRWLAAAVLAIGANAGLEAVFDLAGDTWWGIQNLLPAAGSSETVSQVFWRNFPGLLLNPQFGLSPFGDTPRGQFILLTVPLFLLRWRERFAASYLLLIAISFLHQSHAGLLLAGLVAVDLVLRPALFLTRAGGLVAIAVALFVGRETLVAIIGIARPPLLLAALSAALLVATGLYFSLRPRVGWIASRVRAFRERLLRLGPVAAEGVIIIALLVLSFPLVAAINQDATPMQSIYLWTQVHGRSMAILRPALFLGLSWWLVHRVEGRQGLRRALTIAYVAAAAALVPSLLEAVGHDRHPVARIERQVRAVAAAHPGPIQWPALGDYTEAEVYYGLARELDLAP
jgi:hypothetical protein